MRTISNAFAHLLQLNVFFMGKIHFIYRKGSTQLAVKSPFVTLRTFTGASVHGVVWLAAGLCVGESAGFGWTVSGRKKKRIAMMT